LPVINNKQLSIYILWIIAVMALTIHPIGGIPLFFLALMLSALRLPYYPRLRRPLYYISWLAGAFSLPIFFILYEILNNTPLSRIIEFNPWPLLSLPKFVWYQTYDFPLNMIYNIGSNYIWLYILGILLGIYLIIAKHKELFFNKLWAFIAMLMINYAFAKMFLAFNMQIAYQKDDYLYRILYLLALAVLPIFLTTIYFIYRNIINIRREYSAKLLLISATVLVITIGTYFSYPVYDRYGNSKSFNVTATDIKTVEAIDKDAAGDKYIVLANQMVGAAAIRQYGFSHYYNNNFYYSMPLGIDNIYTDYLAMIESNASRDQALAAMNKAGVNKLYFVVNNYWHSAKQAIRQAQDSADGKLLIDNGVNTVFIYQR